MKNDLRSWLKNCAACQLSSTAEYIKKEPLHPMPIRYIHPFSRWGVDFVGPLPRTENGERYLITAIDYVTKWPIAKAVKEATAEEAASFIEKGIITSFGCPEEIVTDRGTAFNSAVLEKVLDNAKVKHLMTSSYHPRTNGAVERWNGELGKMLSKFCMANKKEWIKFIPQVLLSCRIRLHSSTGYSPFYLTYGRHARIPGDYLQPNIGNDDEDHVGERLDELEKLQDQRLTAKEAVERRREIMKKQYDKNVEVEDINIGDFVLLRNEAKQKLEPQWFGPYIITTVFNNGTVALTDPRGQTIPSRVHRDPSRKQMSTPRCH